MWNKYIDKVSKFMYGRYGPDELYYFLFKVYIFLLLVDLFVNFKVLVYLELVIVIIIMYRFFSKDIYKRREENRKFLKLKTKLTKPFKEFVNHLKDKNYVYKKCRKCGTVLRLPIPDRYGIKHVKCPKCKKRLSVLVLKKEKIEVIKGERSKRR